MSITTSPKGISPLSCVCISIGNEDETTQDSALEEASHDDQAEVKNEAQDMEEMEGDGEVEDGENFEMEEVPSAAEPDNEADGDEIEKNQENPEDFAETSQPAQVEENVEDQAPQQGEEEDQTTSLETEEVDGEKMGEETEEADVAEEEDENQGVSPPHGEDEGRFDVSSQPGKHNMAQRFDSTYFLVIVKQDLLTELFDSRPEICMMFLCRRR